MLSHNGYSFLWWTSSCCPMTLKMDKFRKMVHTPFSNSVCLRALASKTLTLGTGSDARLSRLGSKCSTNWSTGTHSALTTACDKGKPRSKHCYVSGQISMVLLTTYTSVIAKKSFLLGWGGMRVSECKVLNHWIRLETQCTFHDSSLSIGLQVVQHLVKTKASESHGSTFKPWLEYLLASPS